MANMAAMRSTFKIVCRRQCLANADTNVTNQLKAGRDQTARCLVTVTALSNNRLLDPKGKDFDGDVGRSRRRLGVHFPHPSPV